MNVSERLARSAVVPVVVLDDAKDAVVTATALLAGGGMRVGQVIGETDRHGGAAKGKAYTPANVMACLYRHLGIDGEERLSGHGVSYCATCDGFFFKDQDIVVVGGGDSAMEEATFLTRFARSVTVVHRRDELRASAVMAKRAQEDPKISFAWNSRVVELDGEDSLTGVTLEDTVTGERRRLEASGLFVAIGQVPRSELVTDILDLDEAGYIKVEAPSQRTRIPGVFACGDVADPTYQQAITAAGSGCRAALDAEHYLTTLQA